MKKAIPPFLLLLFLTVLVVCSFKPGITGGFRSDESETGEYLNPGAPIVPGNFTEDIFERNAESADKITLEEAIKRAGYPFLLRFTEGKLLEPVAINGIYTDTGQKKRIYGYSFQYSDRIILVVDPSKEPLPVDEALAEKNMIGVSGKRKMNFRLTVRERDGYGKEKSMIKWESGHSLLDPAVLEWSEPGNGEPPFIIYSLYGDCSVSRLREIAGSLSLPAR